MAEEPWDPKLARQATVIEQMKKLGGVMLEQPKPTGFTEPSAPAPESSKRPL